MTLRKVTYKAFCICRLVRALLSLNYTVRVSPDVFAECNLYTQLCISSSVAYIDHTVYEFFFFDHSILAGSKIMGSVCLDSSRTVLVHNLTENDCWCFSAG